MTPAQIEFARALELVCRHLNPPHRPLPVALTLDELGLTGLVLRGQDELLAYRYLRGLELPIPPAPATQSSVLWAAEPGLVHEASAAVELAPGLLAVGDSQGFVRLFSRRGRGRWEAAVALPSHAGAVTALLPVPPAGVMSTGADGRIAIWQADGRGHWRCSEPAHWGAAPGPLPALCRLHDGSVLVAAPPQMQWQLLLQPSGEWSAQPLSIGLVDVVALAPWHDGFAAVQRDLELRLCRAAGAGFEMLPADAQASGANCAIAWIDGGIAVGTESGELMLLDAAADAAAAPAPRTQRLSTAPIRRLQRLGADGLITWSDGGKLRLWRLNAENGRFERLAEFDTAAAPSCFAALCDGRVAYAENRGIALAAPDASGVWRSDELLSGYEAGITALAALAPDRVAIVQRGSRLQMLRLKGEDVELEYTSSRNALQALAAVDDETLACVASDGQLATLHWSAAEGRWGPALVPLSLPPPTAGSGGVTVPRVAGNGGHLLCVLPAQPPQLWRRNGALMQPQPLPPDAPAFASASALAVARNGRCAVASGRSLQVSEDEAWSGWLRPDDRPEIVGLHWLDGNDDLLVLDAAGRLCRVNTRPWQESLVADLSWHLSAHPGALSGVGAAWPAWAMTRSFGPQLGLRDGIGGERSFFGGTRATLRALGASGDTVFGGSDALYVYDLRLQPQVGTSGVERLRARIRRIVVDDEVALVAELDDDLRPGQVNHLLLRRRNGAVWNVRAIAGRALPDDALLQPWVARIAGDGTLADIGGSAHATFNADSTLLRADNPD